MVDFASKKRTNRKPTGRGLFIGALCVIGLVGHALLEDQIDPRIGLSGSVTLTDTFPTS